MQQTNTYTHTHTSSHNSPLHLMGFTAISPITQVSEHDINLIKGVMLIWHTVPTKDIPLEAI